MLYKVRAKYRENRLHEFFRKLKDGTIAMQKPDGAEIAASMQRAKITENGTLEWYETCYCEKPLEHERATVYDFYLHDIQTEQVDRSQEIDGRSFWTFLETHAND